MPDNKANIKVISNCRDCPCFFEESESVMGEGYYFCNLQEPTKPSPTMKHDVDEGVDPRCVLLNSNYVLSLKGK